jgi:uncharacterized membrane protein
MHWIGQFHPQIVHTPIVLLVFSAFFALAGRLFDREWVRRTSVLLLVFGFLGSFVAVRSGVIAHRVPEHQQNVPEEDIDEHGDAGQWTMYLAGGALVAVAIASRLSGTAGGVVGAFALILQLLAAAAVGVTGYRGGELVYQHGANVRIGGELVKDHGPLPATAATPGSAAGDSSGAAPPGETKPDRDDDEK